MYWDGDVVAESEIVEHVDGEEKEDIRYPASHRHGRGFQEPWGVRRGNVSWQREEEGDEELDKGDEKPWESSVEPWCFLRRGYQTALRFFSGGASSASVEANRLIGLTLQSLPKQKPIPPIS